MLNKPLHFYIADDDKDDQLFLQTAIHEVLPDAKITSFSDGIDVLNQVFQISNYNQGTNNLPDIIFLDQLMVTLDGKAVLEMLKQNHLVKKIPVIVLSGGSFQNFEKELADVGADAFYKKPDTLPGLVKIIDEVVNRFLVKTKK
jgi:CheY-like chemotaxis protein